VNVARSMRRDRTWNLRNIEHALPPLLNKQVVQPVPNAFGAFGRGRQEGLVSFVWFVIVLDEVPNVDFLVPKTRTKSAPRGLRFHRSLFSRYARRHEILLLRPIRGLRLIQVARPCASRSSTLRWSGSPR